MKNLIARLCTPYYTEADLRFAVATAKSKIERLTAERNELQAALDGAKLFEQRHRHALTVIERANSQAEEFERKWYLACDERDSLKEGLDGWHSRYLDCEVERDAALAASRHETDMCQQALEDLEKMRGESGVLRDLLAESLSVIKTIDGSDECECDLLESLCDKIKAAIVPKLSHGQQAANEKQLSVDVDLMARGKKMHFVYPPDAQGDDS